MRSVFVTLLMAVVFIGFFSYCISGTEAGLLGNVATQAVATDWWPMFRHDLNHTGVSTSPGSTANNTLWSFATGNSVYSSPAIVDGLVYVGSFDRRVYCLSASNGALVWSYLTAYTVYPSPAVVDGRVYVACGEGSSYGKVYCLNAVNGSWIWDITTYGVDARLSAIYSSPAVVGGRVYVGCNNGGLYCLNATTGAFLWDIGSITGGNLISSPAIAAGLVFIGATDGRIYCRNATDGSPVWNFLTGGAVYSSPTVVGDNVYVGSADGKVYCLDAAIGTSVWNFTTGNIVDSSPAVVDGLLYVGSYDKMVYCLNANTGGLVWNFTTGDVIWASSPAVAGGKVYVGSNDTKLYCLDASTGSLVWSYKTGGGVVSSPSVVDAVYVGSADGNAYAIGEPVFVSMSPSSSVMDVGQSCLFTANVSGGTLPYSYRWFLNGVPVSGATGSNWTFAPVSSGACVIYVNVTDSVGTVVESNTASVTVNDVPSPQVIPTSAAFDVGQSKLFNCTVSGGTSPFSYQWYLDDVAVLNATDSMWTFEPVSSGVSYVYVNVTDDVGVSAKSNVVSVTVNLVPSVAVSPPDLVMNVSESQPFTSVVSNGTPPYTYQWYLNGTEVSGATSSSWAFTPVSADSYVIYLVVTDSAGQIAVSTTSQVTVVIPEFQPLVFLTLFMTATMLLVMLLKTRKRRCSKSGCS